MTSRKPTYPASVFDDPKALVAILGTFWEKFFVGQDQLRSYIDATRFVANENYKQILSAADALNRDTVPVFRNKTLVPLVLKLKDMNLYATNVNRFDNVTSVFNDGLLSFNTKRDIEEYAFPIPAGLVSLNQILDSATAPQHAWLRNTDFVVDRDRDALVFAENPFESAAEKTSVGGEVCLYLWGVCADYDEDLVFNQFGYAAGIKLPSSESYKKLTAAVLAGVVDGGASAKAFDDAVAAICDIPLVKNAEEIVEHIFVDGHGLCVVTDKEVYRYSEKNVPIAGIGQKVFGGQALVDGLVITELTPPNRFEPDTESRPLCRAIDTYLATQDYEFFETQDEELIALSSGAGRFVRKQELRALAMGSGFLTHCFYGDLVFENKDVPVVVDETHPSGYTYASFEVNGHPADVSKFFDEIHQRGIEMRRPCEIDCCIGPAFKEVQVHQPLVTAINENGTTYIPKYLTKGVKNGWLINQPENYSINGRATPGAIVELESAYDLAKKVEIDVGVTAVVDVCGNFHINAAGTLPYGSYALKFNQTFPPGMPMTLARMLDKRKYAETEPTAQHLPQTINPLRFLIDNVLRNNVFVARIKVSGLGQNHLGLYNIKHLRQLLPPQTALITVFEFNPADEQIDSRGRVAETIEKFKGIEPVTDTLDDENVVDLGARLFVVSGTCQ
jgi:hypothetical protein